MKNNLMLLLLLGALMQTGCATNPIAKNYQSFMDRMPPSLQQRLLPPSQTPRLFTASSESYTNEVRRLTENGYALVGVSRFAGSNPSDRQVVDYAKSIGADAALWDASFSGTEQGMRPLMRYEPGKTTTTTRSGSANVNVYGGGESASANGTYSGQSTTTTPGEIKTQYVPYQKDVYAHLISFWRRARPGALGVRCAILPDELRTTLKRNTGAYVTEVVIDSPAFKANILRGDTIIQLGEIPISSPQDLNNQLAQLLGQKVTTKILREGKVLEIPVQMNKEL